MCSGCADCDGAVMQAQIYDKSATPASGPSETPIRILDARFEGFGHRAIALKTGPPGDAPFLRSTPIALKQRLLI